MEMMVDKDELRRLLLETNLSEEVEKEVAKLNLPEPPVLPDGKPRNFKEALFFKGFCAIPLFGKNEYIFMVFKDGAPVRNTKTGDYVEFTSYNDADKFMTGFKEYLDMNVV